jgi:hypothetical protein
VRYDFCKRDRKLTTNLPLTANTLVKLEEQLFEPIFFISHIRNKIQTYAVVASLTFYMEKKLSLARKTWTGSQNAPEPTGSALSTMLRYL